MKNENTSIQYTVWFINTEVSVSVFIVKSIEPVSVLFIEASGASQDLVYSIFPHNEALNQWENMRYVIKIFSSLKPSPKLQRQNGVKSM